MQLQLTARVIKTTILLDPAQLAGVVVPNGLKTVPLKVIAAGRTLSAELNPKTLRRCLATIAEAGEAGVAVVLQGKLEGDRLAEAGIVAQVKMPKAEAAAA